MDVNKSVGNTLFLECILPVSLLFLVCVLFIKGFDYIDGDLAEVIKSRCLILPAVVF